MGYKQHNNPFNRKISSPLKHNVTNAKYDQTLRVYWKDILIA